MNTQEKASTFLARKNILKVLFCLALICTILVLASCRSGEDENNENNKCFDMDCDHKCDVCDKILNECIDTDADHICNVCNAEMAACPIDADKNHFCDICGLEYGKCYDLDGNHFCDFCGMSSTPCTDKNHDHLCDFCKLELTFCADMDDDHICDICKRKLSKCEDYEDPFHFCDICDNVISKCADHNKDHFCDTCSLILSKCGDNNFDHYCDICEDRLSECRDDGKNYICDICGCALAFISFTADKDCLINGEKGTVSLPHGEQTVVFTYQGDKTARIICWIIYNSEGEEIDRAEPGEFYVVNVAGRYHASPLFEGDEVETEDSTDEKTEEG